jgi:hypothetical protein
MSAFANLMDGPPPTRTMFRYDLDNLATMFGPTVYNRACLYIAIYRNDYILTLLMILKRSGNRGIPRNNGNDAIVYNALYDDYLKEVASLLDVLKNTTALIDDSPEHADIKYRYLNYLGYNALDYMTVREALIEKLIY